MNINKRTDGAFSIVEYGDTEIVIDIDHGNVDDKGRKIGGRASVSGIVGGWSVRIQAMRDGVTFGASRRATTWNSRDNAIAAAKRKLTEQGKRYKGGAS